MRLFVTLLGCVVVIAGKSTFRFPETETRGGRLLAFPEETPVHSFQVTYGTKPPGPYEVSGPRGASSSRAGAGRVLFPETSENHIHPHHGKSVTNSKYVVPDSKYVHPVKDSYLPSKEHHHGINEHPHHEKPHVHTEPSTTYGGFAPIFAPQSPFTEVEAPKLYQEGEEVPASIETILEVANFYDRLNDAELVHGDHGPATTDDHASHHELPDIFDVADSIRNQSQQGQARAELKNESTPEVFNGELEASALGEHKRNFLNGTAVTSIQVSEGTEDVFPNLPVFNAPFPHPIIPNHYIPPNQPQPFDLPRHKEPNNLYFDPNVNIQGHMMGYGAPRPKPEITPVPLHPIPFNEVPPPQPLIPLPTDIQPKSPVLLQPRPSTEVPTPQPLIPLPQDIQPKSTPHEKSPEANQIHPHQPVVLHITVINHNPDPKVTVVNNNPERIHLIQEVNVVEAPAAVEKQSVKQIVEDVVKHVVPVTAQVTQKSPTTIYPAIEKTPQPSKPTSVIQTLIQESSQPLLIPTTDYGETPERQKIASEKPMRIVKIKRPKKPITTTLKPTEFARENLEADTEPRTSSASFQIPFTEMKVGNATLRIAANSCPKLFGNLSLNCDISPLGVKRNDMIFSWRRDSSGDGRHEEIVISNGNSLLIDDSRYEVLPTDSGSQLTIRNITVDDCGTYVCEAFQGRGAGDRAVIDFLVYLCL